MSNYPPGVTGCEPQIIGNYPPTMEDIIDDMQYAYPELTFNYSGAYGPSVEKWHCVYIVENKIQYGRLKFLDKGNGPKLFSSKNYAEKYRDMFSRFGIKYHTWFFLTVSFFLTWGTTPFSLSDALRMTLEAERIQKESMKAKQDWREANPKKNKRGYPIKRKSLEKAWDGKFRELVGAALQKAAMEQI